MLGRIDSAIALPPRPDRVPIEELAVKEALGFALWNSRVGSAACLYLARVKHPETGQELARFFGGTSVPTSSVSSWNQSLLWTQTYFEEPIQQCAIAGYVVLHRAFFFNQPMFENALNTSEVSRGAVPGYEIHGLLPTDEGFLSRHESKLVQVTIKDGVSPVLNPALAINNAGQAAILRHFVQCLSSGEMSCMVERNVASVRGRNSVRV